VRTRRRSSGSKRTRATPAKSRVTVRRASASPRGASSRRDAGRAAGVGVGAAVDVAAALRSSREALLDIEGQLDALLAALRDPAGALDARAADRLRGATRDAGTALATLGAAALASY
jgi:hypothetical protein